MNQNKETFVSLFVYGTLKEGFPLFQQGWMDGAKKVGADALTGYMLVSFGMYPIMGKLHQLESKNKIDCCVLGEVWQVPTTTFDALKEMEEDAGYRTEQVVTDSGRKVNAFTYFDVVSGAYSWEKTSDQGTSKRMPIGRVEITSLDVVPF